MGRWAGRWALGGKALACWACWVRAAGERERACRRAGALGVQASGRAGRAGEREWGVQARSAGTQGRAERRRAGGSARGRRRRARGTGRGRAGRAAWACLCTQAGRAGWSAGLVLVHSAPGSVLTQFSVPFDSVFS